MKLLISVLVVEGLTQRCRAGVSGETGLCDANCVGVDCLEVVEREVPAVMCSAGFVYDGDAACCVMDEETEPTFVCADGSPSDGYMCPRKSQPVFTCDEDFKLVDGSCVQESKGTMVTECPPNSIMDGSSCVERMPVDLIPECPISSTEEEGACFTTKSFGHSFVCPERWNLHAGRCVMEELVDCTDEQLPGEECGEQCYVDMQCSGSQCFASREVIQRRIAERKGKRFLAADSVGAAVCSAQPCKVMKLTPKPDAIRFELVTKTCLKRTETDPEVFCEGPPAAVFNGETCCMKIPVPPLYKCPISRFGSTDMDCFQLRRRDIQSTCPRGFEKRWIRLLCALRTRNSWMACVSSMRTPLPTVLTKALN
ncbi:MAG: hypothetical protein KVP17_001239 [Porospora cf. gigantea B]|uniref:uncharacterized protein n=1 Tax=Porospora cf. gigantea B TaxID=2853592 RepID=UPI003571EC0C|nr:MAG: hypothetical protein KVP17_001239 [Porospora cf. gigantea B]